MWQCHITQEVLCSFACLPQNALAFLTSGHVCVCVCAQHLRLTHSTLLSCCKQQLPPKHNIALAPLYKIYLGIQWEDAAEEEEDWETAEADDMPTAVSGVAGSFDLETTEEAG